MLHAVKDVHSILSGVARALKTTRYGEPPNELPPRLTKLVERLEGQSGHVKDKRNGLRAAILRPLHGKVVCGFLWSPLFTEAKSSGHPAQQKISTEGRSPL
jgi:hypothetical protein